MSRYVYLVEALPVDDDGTEQPQRWSCGQTTGQPYGGYEWVNCLLPASGETGGPFTYSAEIALDTTVGGRTVLGYGALRLAMQFLDDGALTLLALLHWDGRGLRIWRILEGAAFDTETTAPMFVGTTDEPTWGVVEATVPLFDRGRLLDVPLQDRMYLGTGELEGHTGLKGVRKPIGFGPVAHAEPVALDHAQPQADESPYARAFQFSDGQIVFSAPYAPVLYERGLVFGPSATYQGAPFLWDPPIAGAVIFEITNGYGRTGSVPQGVLTVSFTGNPEALIPSPDPYPDCTYANVMRAVVRLRDRIPAAWIDEDALTAFTASAIVSPFPERVGIYVTDDRTVAAVLDTLAVSAGAAWAFTPDGLFAVRRVGFRASLATFDADTCLDDLRPVTLPPPVWRSTYGYAPCERVLGDSDFGDALVPATTREFLVEPVRNIITERPALRVVRPLARESTVAGRNHAFAPAGYEAERIHDLLAQHRRQYVVTVRVPYGTLREGDTVTLVAAAFGLTSGGDFLIRRIEHRPALLPDDDQAELTLWGPFVVGEDVRLAA